MSKFVLSMIVKNEAKIIERSLSSTEQIIDFISICDTGSTDDTVQIIQRWAAERQIPCVVHQAKQCFREYLEDFRDGNHSPWQVEWGVKYQEDPDWKRLQQPLVGMEFIYELLNEQHEKYPLRLPGDTTFIDFGKNRSQSFNLARQSFPEADYVLLCDADISYRISDNFTKKNLTNSGYRIHQKSSLCQYDSVKLLSTSFDWSCKCKTHEYWSCPGEWNFPSLPKDQIWIEDYGDGGCKDDKFQRDIRLLEEVLEEDTEIYYQGLRQRARPHAPSNGEVVRANFYLAQTYACLGRPRESNKYYKHCFKISTWEAEKWCCLYKIALNHRNKYLIKHGRELVVDDEDYILMNYYFKEAHDFRPQRIESIYQALLFHSGLNVHLETKIAKQLCNYAYFIYQNPGILEIGQRDTLFVEPNCYQDCQELAEYTLSYLGFWLKKYDIGLAACDRLLARDDANEVRRAAARQAREFYLSTSGFQEDF